MKRVLLIPAAGMGTRLGSDVPKLLHPVLGKPMLDHLLELYRPFVDRVVLVIHPSFEPAVLRHCAMVGADPEIAFQQRPTGMLRAILEPRETIASADPEQVWITWCDQIAVEPGTVGRLAEVGETADLALPTVQRRDPYIHFRRDADGRIVEALQAREGDAMPSRGESDSGLFSLSAPSYLERLPVFASSAPRGRNTGEVNFLPFIPWIARSGVVRTFPLRHEVESVGINTREEQERVERYLVERG